MRVLVTGVDGYLGWPLAQYLASRGHRVSGCDSLARRRWVTECGSHSAFPIASMERRMEHFSDRYGDPLHYWEGDLTDYGFVAHCLKRAQPDAIVHLGQMPSAPFSMIDVHHCVYTHTNNLTSTLNLLHAVRDLCPAAHLVKLGSMGEYGTPDIEIPEGSFEIEYRDRSTRLPFPRQAGSWYHQTKVHDTHNIMMACRLWGLRSTDVMQGVVFGSRIREMGNDPEARTRFDFDQCFGTVINRFCAMAIIGRPLSLYGSGGQRRGFLTIQDSMQCLALAVENPPHGGEYRTFNQFAEIYGISELADHVRQVAEERLGLEVRIDRQVNPRVEAEEHFYWPQHGALPKLGFVPSGGLDDELEAVLRDLTLVRDRILARSEALSADIRWDGRREPVSPTREGGSSPATRSTSEPHRGRS